MLIEGDISTPQTLSYVNSTNVYFPGATDKFTLIDDSYIDVTWYAQEYPLGLLHVIDPMRGIGYMNKFIYDQQGTLAQVQSFEFNDWVVYTNHRSRSFIINISPAPDLNAQLAMIYYLDAADIQRTPLHRLEDLKGMRLTLEPDRNSNKEFSIGLPIDFYPNEPFLFCGTNRGLVPCIDPKNDQINLVHNQRDRLVTLKTFFWRGRELLATSNQVSSAEISIPTHAVVM